MSLRVRFVDGERGRAFGRQMPGPAHLRMVESPDSAPHAGMARYARVGPRARVAPRAVDCSSSPSPVVAPRRFDRHELPGPAHLRMVESPDSAPHAGMARYVRVGPRARVAPRAVDRSRSPSPVAARHRFDGRESHQLHRAAHARSDGLVAVPRLALVRVRPQAAAGANVGTVVPEVLSRSGGPPSRDTRPFVSVSAAALQVLTAERPAAQQQGGRLVVLAGRAERTGRLGDAPMMSAGTWTYLALAGRRRHETPAPVRPAT